METKGVNPFLFEEEDLPSSNSAPLNPFLMEEDDFIENTNDNPFLSQSAVTVAPTYTNPFAFDAMDLDPSEAEPAIDITTNFHNITNNDANIIDPSINFQANTNFGNFNVGNEQITNLITNTVPQKPTDLDLKHTHTVDAHNVNQINSMKQDYTDPNSQNGMPRRPPPPRPPPSKETQDLLMSVMGAMDATSSHLLDRIPPTRTPSPVSMRDLHSPSPTPEPVFADLLDVSETKEEPHNPVHDSDLLSLNDDNICDINQNPSLFDQSLPISAASLMQQAYHDSQPIMNQTEINQPPIMNQPIENEPIPTEPAISKPVITQLPPRPAPPPVPRPPRPSPPQKPPPPAIPPNVPQVPVRVPPPLPQPVHVEGVNIENSPNKIQTNLQEDDMFDMFGVEEVKQPQKVIASTADIMNLYSLTQVISKPKEPDLLFDSLETEVKPSVVIYNNQNETVPVVNTDNINAVITEPIDSLANTPVIQDSIISPEPSQSDLQMDTSDSQSKGSVSSVTFNPFAGNEDNISPIKPNLNQQETPVIVDAFTTNNVNNINQNQDIFGLGETKKTDDEFDAFAMKFESAAKDENKNGIFDAFTDSAVTTDDAWGNSGIVFNEPSGGFDNEEPFDAFLSMQDIPSVPQSTPNKMSKAPSQDSDEDKDFSVFIRPKDDNAFANEILPVLAPPPSGPIQSSFSDTSPRFNPFDQQDQVAPKMTLPDELPSNEILQRTDSQETPPTPLFDDDVSQPLEPFPRILYSEDGWEMQLRQPNKKKITGQRFWKKIHIRLLNQSDCILLQLFNQRGDKDPFQELPLQPCYSVSDIGAQQYDNYGKIFTLKLQYIFYKERPGVRPGQVKKAERITNKLSQFASYAIQGDYQGVKEFGSDLKKLGLPVEHAPQLSQLMKLGSLNFEDLKQFSVAIEEALFKLQAHRDRALHYKMEEVQITSVDELYVEQDAEGHIHKQIARVRLLFLGFLTGMPDIELGINDMRRQGKEVVGRHDIIPVVTEEWIRLENVEFHSCIQQDEYENSHIIKFKPPDACYIELLRFRVRPPKNRELPLQLKASINVTGNKVLIKADVLVPGFASRKLGQVPCEDVMIRIPVPEVWIYLFRVEKHFRYGSVKSTHRRSGKIKGIERILGTMETLQESLIEVTSGQAKYEHQHRSIVWRCPRLPKEGQGAYTTHNLVCRLALTSYDQVPDQLAEYAYVEFTMPATQVSHTTVRSVSLQNSDSDDPPEKYVRYLARHEYRVGIEHTEGDTIAAYSAVTTVAKPAPAPIQEQPPTIAEDESSDSDD